MFLILLPTHIYHLETPCFNEGLVRLFPILSIIIPEACINNIYNDASLWNDNRCDFVESLKSRR